MDEKLITDALNYHQFPRPGKVDVISAKPCRTERDLSLAYSPGVAAPCIEIAKNPDKAYEYTSKGNLVAVITNGTAVLGLGDIGPLAGKPVMEGKGVLFKQFADINVYDIEIDAKDPDKFIAAVKALEPTFGGINLEDIKAPECFYIEKKLKEEMKIPVFHDDQHGTAIICGAALINAVHLTKRKMEEVKIVVNGAGAAAITCAKIFTMLGVPHKNILMCDSKGVVTKTRKDLNEFKIEFAQDSKCKTLADALKDADCFVGLSVAGAVTGEMLKAMNKNPIVFAMANPEPEILPPEAKAARPDVIIATGRSDFPNQVNNVLGFPYIFRGALDVRATTITENMKLAAVKALAALAREDVPDQVVAAYRGTKFHFGPNYIIPKPFDSRVLLWVAPAVAKAAIADKVAAKPITDFHTYVDKLASFQSSGRGFIRDTLHQVKDRAQASGHIPKIVFPEGRSEKILRAVMMLKQENVIEPILVGYEPRIREKIQELDLPGLNDVKISDPSTDPRAGRYADMYYEMRKRKGILKQEAERRMIDTNYFASMMVASGDADALVSGSTQNYAEAVKPILDTIGAKRIASGMNIVLVKNRMLIFADTTMNINPTAEQVATIAIHASKIAGFFKMTPRIAMLSYTNFTSRGDSPNKMKDAVNLIKQIFPNIIVDGEMQADTAVNADIMERLFPFSRLNDGSAANILIFPNLDAGNIAYKLVQQLAGGEVFGPFLMGLRKPAHIVQRTCTVEDIFNTVALTALQTQIIKELEQAKRKK
jgi:malate dehydrogenase (oxaloacetate-decarboxylating)(NADP+)